MQTFTGITVAQYNIEPNSGLTVSQTVAASIGDNVVPWDVAITSVIASPTSSTAIVVGYTVRAPSAPFANRTAAYAMYSHALAVSVTSGTFKSLLKPQAAANLAIYLAANTVTPQEPLIQNVPFTSSPSAMPSYLPDSPTPLPSAVPSTIPTMRPTPLPTYGTGQSTLVPTVKLTLSPTLTPKSGLVALYVLQTIDGISPNRFNSEPNSRLTIQQVVAASIGNNISSLNVAITSVMKVRDASASSIALMYTITAPIAPFDTTAAAVTGYSNALTTSVTHGDFAADLVAQAADNGATSLASVFVTPQQAIIQTTPFDSATASTFMPGSPTPVPSSFPTARPTVRPSSSPSFAVGSPTPVPAVHPTMSPTAAPLAYLYIVQVCWNVFRHFLS